MRIPDNDSNPILIVDDDPDDLFLIRKAIRENEIPNPVVCVRDGEEALEYLRREDRFAEVPPGPLPSLILLDLNMPRMNGHETLRVLKGDRALKSIPAVVLSTSASPEDVSKAYELGANAYISKPDSYDKLVATVKALKDFWLQTARPPMTQENRRLS